MNPNIQQLYGIASKPKRLIIGLMSGTSLDGLDIALCSVEGSGTDTKLELLHFETVPYGEDMRNELQTVFAKKNIDLEKLCLLHPWLARQHAAAVNDCLQKWEIRGADIDLLASHGQTIYHAPQRLHQQQKFGNATLQIGDGDQLALATGIITISDFRQKNIAAGGEGAPLAVYGDHLLFSKAGEDRLMLNIGGIANFTFLPGSGEVNEILCTDLGPGNTLMDAFMREQFPRKYFDENGMLAKGGSINPNLLEALKQDAFFLQPFPKTTGPELFNGHYLQLAKERSGTPSISAADTMATLNRFSADMIITGINKCLSNNLKLHIICSGGGIHNPVLMDHLEKLLAGCRFDTTAAMGINPDAKEAVLFALLANECVCGNGSDFGNALNGIPPISMGKISFPV